MFPSSPRDGTFSFLNIVSTHFSVFLSSMKRWCCFSGSLPHSLSLAISSLSLSLSLFLLLSCYLAIFLSLSLALTLSCSLSVSFSTTHIQSPFVAKSDGSEKLLVSLNSTTLFILLSSPLESILKKPKVVKHQLQLLWGQRKASVVVRKCLFHRKPIN